jgi:hypothetical protein
MYGLESISALLTARELITWLIGKVLFRGLNV